LGGFDTHSGQSERHAMLLRTLSLALGDFQTALDDMGMSNEVTTYTVSDFGRSVGSNGDGTDHAWGGHYFVMGGAVKPGLYGKLPDLTLGGNDDIGSKGRLIPTTSYDTYMSTILKWFGVSEVDREEIFPNLVNFEGSYDLGFMQT
jgi:uncharacterized protein (DUF1501 family)